MSSSGLLHSTHDVDHGNILDSNRLRMRINWSRYILSGSKADAETKYLSKI